MIGGSDAELFTFHYICPIAELRLVLISRTESRLEEEARLLQDKFGVEVKIIPADLSSSDEAVFARIGQGLEGLDIGILVNNAGMSYPHPEYLHLVDDETLTNLINLNVATLTKARDVWWLKVALARWCSLSFSNELAPVTPFPTDHAAVQDGAGRHEGAWPRPGGQRRERRRERHSLGAPPLGLHRQQGLLGREGGLGGIRRF